jgi:hypothetical protein
MRLVRLLLPAYSPFSTLSAVLLVHCLWVVLKRNREHVYMIKQAYQKSVADPQFAPVAMILLRD